MSNKWTSYYDAIKGSNPPRRTLVVALQSWHEKPGIALDLGCGSGRDTLYLLSQGWRVYAIDAELEALSRVEQNVPETERNRVTPMLMQFEKPSLPPADLVNSSYAMPFCSPKAFSAFWDSVSASLWEGGILAGQLFGDRDQWASWPPNRERISFHARPEVERLLSGWEIIELGEAEFDGTTATGEPKHWHVYDIVARKTQEAVRYPP